MRIRHALSYAAVSVLVAAGVQVPRAAHADVAATMPLTRVTRVAVDRAHGRVFLNTYNDSIRSVDDVLGFVTTDLAGGNPQSFAPLKNAAGMALSPDSSRLYVALPPEKKVVAVDPVTLAQVASYPFDEAPWTVATDGKWLLVGVKNPSYPRTPLAAIDTTAETPQPVWVQQVPGAEPPRMGSTPARPGRVFASTWNAFHVLDTTGETPVVTSQTNPYKTLHDVSADGSRILTSGFDYATNTRAVVVQDADDLSVVAEIPAPERFGSFVLSGDGSTVAMSADREWDTPETWTAAPVVRTVAVGGTNALHDYTPLNDYPRALVWDGDRLFAASAPSARNRRVALHRYDSATLPSTTIDVTAPSSATRATEVPFMGTLRFGGDGAPPAARVLHLSKTDLAGTHALADVTAAEDGVFWFVDTPQVGGTNTYRLTWDGDEHTAPATETFTVAVSRLATSLTFGTSATTIDQGRYVVLSGRLGTTYNSRRVSLYSQVSGKPRVGVRHVTADAAGNWSATVGPLAYTTTFTAIFAGDYRYAPVSVGRKVAVRLGLRPWMRGYYATSGAYHLYHHNVNLPALVTATTPVRTNFGLVYKAQYYENGAWRWTTDNKLAWVHNGQTTTFLRRDWPIGVPLRMRHEFSGDALNAPNVGAWRYLRTTR